MRRLALALFVLAGCSHDDLPFEVVKSDRPRLTTANADDVQSAARSTLAFALDLDKQLGAGPPANLIFSPHSIAEALLMTYAGAANATAAQMRAVLRLELPDERAQGAMNGVDLALRSYSSSIDPSSFTIKVQDELWARPGFHFQAPFLDTLAANYGTGVNLLDFQADPDGSRQVINDWVAKQTEDHIKDLIPSGGIMPDTAVVLTNAVYFKASWASSFFAGATEPEPFHRADGTTAMVPTMVHTARHGLYRTSELTAVALPYRGDQVELVIILPNDLSSFAAGLSPAALEPILAGVDGSSEEVELHLPKLELRSSPELGEALKALGMKDAFRNGVADFSGINGGSDLFVTSVPHQAWVKLDEEGTEAAAATAVILTSDLSARIPVDPTVVKIDRPFLFLIRDRSTGEPVFFGRVVDPGAGA